MPPQRRASFGVLLKRALEAAGVSQAALARHLRVDAAQVSRWVNSTAVPSPSQVSEMEQKLGTELAGALAAEVPDYELFVSAPVAAVGREAFPAQQASVLRVIEALEQHVSGVYWAARDAKSIDDSAAPDLAAEQNLRVLAHCHAYLYLQFAEVIGPSSALIELGFALGQRIKTTVIILDGLALPYMLNGFQGVAASLSFLPKARIYERPSVDSALALVTRNGRDLLGLN